MSKIRLTERLSSLLAAACSDRLEAARRIARQNPSCAREPPFKRHSSASAETARPPAIAAEVIRTLGDRRVPLIITRNGEAKVVMQVIDSYRQTQEMVARLKTLAPGSRQVEAGQVQPAADVIAPLRERWQAR